MYGAVGPGRNSNYTRKIMCFRVEGNNGEAIKLYKHYDFIVENNYFENNGIYDLKPTITVDSQNGNAGYNLVIRKNRIAGSGLSGDSATYGIDLINGGIAGSIAENSFMNNKKGSIHYVAGTAINIENNYVGGSETLVVGNYRNYGTTYSHIFQFSPANRKDADITVNYDNLYSVYPYLDSNGEYRMHFIEYTGNQYQIRDLDSMQKVTYLPAANVVRRGQMVIMVGGSGVADACYVCRKKADDTYEWKQLDI